MKGVLKNRKGQALLEILIVLFTIIVFFFFGGLYSLAEQGISESTDMNDIALARESASTLKEAVNMVGFSGVGARKEVVIHIPFDTVRIDCNGSKRINFMVLLYSPNCTNRMRYPDPEKPGELTPYCYMNITEYTDFPVNYCQLCDPTHRQNRTAWDTSFCCDAGFNMHMAIEKDQYGDININQRRYWATTKWI